ncbi:MAG: aspartate-semialdehyde dehydrogenase [Actinobacteria bacterium]|nr:aspartate-semialdehyde dehydrogenase [Actinomycetota bacterium]MCZ6630049.1 aspartate-semialdehyde dehydrogenase [Actinomycetota bacterium]
MTKVAIVGATGAVGRTMLSILEERDGLASNIRLMASHRSAGQTVSTRWGEIEVEDLAGADPSGIDIALFSAGGDRSLEHARRFVESGSVVIDNSSAFRMDPDVPLVVAQVNDEAAGQHKGIIANPNCTTMTLMMAAAPLHEAAGLTSIVAASYQSVSGSGQHGVEELMTQNRRLESGLEEMMQGGWTDPEPELYERPIGYNVLPFAGSEVEGGYTDEEMKLVRESRKILDIPDLAVEPTCVRVPVLVGHGVAATLRFERPLNADEAASILGSAPGLSVWKDMTPTPLDSAGLDEVLVGRIRETLGAPGGINLWVVGDNLRKGAALNAVQIAELLV